MKVHSESQVPVSNRGLNYGDGFFETLLFQGGACHLLKYHLARLVNTAHRLGMAITQDDAIRLSKDVLAIIDEAKQKESCESWIVKLVVTREAGGRGYRSLENAEAEVNIQLFPYHAVLSDDVLVSGVPLRVCDIRLSRQPALAGLKHLCRLENVLARNEWRDERIFEGLLLDQNGLLIEATQSNVFLRLGDRWLTPVLNQCGVSGVMRQWILDHAQELGGEFRETTLSLDDVSRATSCFICNSVIGVVPVQSVVFNKFEGSSPQANKHFDVQLAYQLSQQVRQILV